MKLLLKLLGVNEYIENLEAKLFDKDQYYSNRLTEQKEVNNILNKERNELLSTKTRLTAEVLKLREQLEEATKKVEVLEQLNEDFVSTNTNLLEIQNKLISEVEFLCNRVLELKITND